MRFCFMLLFTVPMAWAGCNRGPSGNDRINYSEIAVRIDWSLSGVHPEDATVLFYRQGDDRPAVHFMTSEEEVVRLAEGVYSVIVFNRKFDDFDAIAFRNTGSYETIQAYAKPKGDGGSAEEITGLCPDLLAVDSRERFEVTPEMIDQTRDNRAHGKQGSAYAAATLRFVPQPVVKPLSLSVYIRKLCNIRPGTARGTVSGFAESVFLNSRRTTPIRVTHGFDFEESHYLDNTDGVMEGSLTVFGLCSEASKADAEPLYLTFTALLRDKTASVYSSTIEIGELIAQPPEENTGMRIEIGTDDGTNPPLEIPGIEIEEDSAFDPGVNEWGDGEVIDKVI